MKKSKSNDITSILSTYISMITLGIIFISVNNSSLFFFIGIGLLFIASMAGTEELKKTGIEINYIYFIYIGIILNVAAIFLWAQLGKLGNWLEHIFVSSDWVIIVIRVIFLLLMYLPIFALCSGLIGIIVSIITNANNESNKENAKMLISFSGVIISFLTMLISVYKLYF
ncbi:hypothetical protein [Lentibacillus sediminis]|uniref:hypothetical protein n=1 Tax=Lentibacillus sediminis TaxID=1940529 RepID=UPI000C1BA67C|nr:hypothetical protein [Lentibacillus sediminis]